MTCGFTWTGIALAASFMFAFGICAGVALGISIMRGE